MFAYCENCNYDSGDKPSLEELRLKVLQDGGWLARFSSSCPRCGSELRID